MHSCSLIFSITDTRSETLSREERTYAVCAFDQNERFYFGLASYSIEGQLHELLRVDVSIENWLSHAKSTRVPLMKSTSSLRSNSMHLCSTSPTPTSATISTSNAT